MAQGLTERSVFDWLGRPFEDLRVRVGRLREATREQVDGIKKLLAQREALLAQEQRAKTVPPPAPAPTRPPPSPVPSTGQTLAELQVPASTQLDLRVRSAMIRDGSAGEVRQEMAALVSLLGLHSKLDVVSEQAYALVAAAEALLSLLRGDGWLFAHRDITSATEDLGDALDRYRGALTHAQDEFEEKANLVEHRIARQVWRYRFARYFVLVLLFLGPGIAFWSGLQLGYEPGAPKPLYFRVPKRARELVALLGERGELQRTGDKTTVEPWRGRDPRERVGRLLSELDDDHVWTERLCSRLSRLTVDAALRESLVLHCDRLTVGTEASQQELRAVRETLQAQDALSRDVVRRALEWLPTDVPAAPGPGDSGPQQPGVDEGSREVQR